MRRPKKRRTRSTWMKSMRLLSRTSVTRESFSRPDVDDDIAHDDEDYHSALLDYREASDLLKEACGSYPVVVPTRPDKPKVKGKGESAKKKLDVARLAKDRRVLDDRQTLSKNG